jgi:hypothetical protein
MVVLALLTACGAPDVLDDGLRVARGGDLVVADVEVSVRDSVAGDVMVAGGAVLFTGVVGGDVLTVGGDQRLAGSAEGSVRAAGAQVRLDTEVGRNLTIAAGRVLVGRGARVTGNAYLVGGAIRLDGAVGQLVRIAGSDVVINGHVAGDVLVEARRLTLGPAAVIDGDLRYRLSRGEDMVVEAGARVEGQVLPLGRRPGAWIRWALRGLRILGFLIAGVIVVGLLPGLSLAAERRIRVRPFASFGGGLLVLLLVPVLLALLAITIIGVPLAVYLALVYLAPIVVALWLGRLLLSASAYPERGELVVAFLVGGVILGLLGLIPYAGLVLRGLTTILGAGAFAVALWEGAVEVESRRA